MSLRHLDTPTLLRHAYADQDDLTTSDLERELLRRLEAIDTDTLDAAEELDFSGEELRNLAEAYGDFDTADVVKVLDAVNAANFDAHTLGGLLNLLSTEEITEVSELKDALELAAKFQDIANDLAEVLPRLSTLITETQE